MSTKKFGELVGAIDDGTSSARFALFKLGTSEIVCYHQQEIRLITPREGWVEQNALDILDTVQLCIEKTIEKLIELGGSPTVICSFIFLCDIHKSFIAHATPIGTVTVLNFSVTRFFIQGYCWRWHNESTRDDHCMGQAYGSAIAQCHHLAGRSNSVNGGRIGRTAAATEQKPLSVSVRFTVVHVLLGREIALANW